MKANLRRSEEIPGNNDKTAYAIQNKFELLNCPRNGIKCREQLSVINKSYLESYIHQRDKNYPSSIEALKNAYYKTTELSESTCTKCARFFRSTIANTLEDIHKDLHKMSTGFFKTKRFHDSYVKAGQVLNEFKQESLI
jgi:hypothetical protein